METFKSILKSVGSTTKQSGKGLPTGTNAKTPSKEKPKQVKGRSFKKLIGKYSGK